MFSYIENLYQKNLYFLYSAKMEVKMIKDKVKKSLEICRDGKCNECLYNGWIREVCQKILIDDTLKILNKED